MLEGPGTSHRCDAEWSLKNLFLWGLHCQKVLRAEETHTHTHKEGYWDNKIKHNRVLHTMLLSGHVSFYCFVTLILLQKCRNACSY